jgi:outer membrane immunogenic protein
VSLQKYLKTGVAFAAEIVAFAQHESGIDDRIAICHCFRISSTPWFNPLILRGLSMKKFLLAGVATVALIGTASAADLGIRKAPPMVAPPAPVFSWTGCFVGAHVGWGWGKKDNNETFDVFTTSGDHVLTAQESSSITTSGGLFGGQIGCDYQFGVGKGFGPGGWVIGIQGDIAGADINGVGTDPLVQNIIPILTPFARIAVKEDAIASVTARLGFSVWPQSLLYVRGGVAWTHDRWDLHGSFFGLLGDSEVTNSRSGWTVGAGWEWAFLPNWSAFVEWNHYEFGHHDLISDGLTFGEFVISDTFNAKQRVDTAKIGVNWRFNLFGKAPVQARY